MSWLGGLLSAGSVPEITTPSETLLRRLDEALVLEERKKVLAQLRDNSSVDSAQHQIIGKSLPSLINILKIDREHTEIVRDCLETLTNIFSISNNPNHQTRPLPSGSAELINIDFFLKDAKNLTAVLDLLDDRDYAVRFQVTQLLRILLSNRSQQLQQTILVVPMGIARLMDLLKENRELIRNEALLVLLELCKSGSQEVQKIVAFEGAFEVLLGIIHEEGGTEGSIVVQDCLQLINNLLKDNVSNQNYFRETSCISKLGPLLQLSSSDLWILTDDKTAILLLALKLVSLLVTGNNPNAHTNQTVLCKTNILNMILALALGRINAPVIRTKALYTLGDLIYGNKDNCTHFSTLQIRLEDSTPVPSGQADPSKTQPAIARLLVVVLSANDIKERLAAARVYKCYLYENEEGQLALASTLTPPPTSSSPSTNDPSSIGTQLINHLLSWEDSQELYPYRSWLSCLILIYILKDDQTSKELVLKIPLEIPKSGMPIVNLLSKCTRSLMLCCRLVQPGSAPTSGTGPTVPGTTGRPLAVVKIGLLRLMSTWMDNCPTAVKFFLAAPNNVPFLVELILGTGLGGADPEGNIHVQGLASLLLGLCFRHNEDDPSSPFNKSSLHNVITQRIGIDQFNSKLDALKRTEQFVKAEQSLADVNEALLIDDISTYVKQYQQQQPVIYYYDYDFTLFYKATVDKIQKQLKSPKSFSTPKQTKQPAKESAPPVASVSTASLTQPAPVENSQGTEAVLHSYKELIRQQDRELESLKRRNQELEEAVSKQGSVSSIQSGQTQQEIQNLQNQNASQSKTIVELQSEITALQNQLEQQQDDDRPSSTEFLALTQGYNQLQQLLVSKDDQIRQLQQQLQQQPKEIQSPPIFVQNPVNEEEIAEYKRKIEALESSLQNYEQTNADVNRQIESLTKQLQASQTAQKEAEAKFDSLEKEQEELLLELANYEVENTELKAKLSIYESEDGEPLPQ